MDGHMMWLPCSVRDGVMQEMLARWLVPGDVVHIALGDRVPADIRLIEVGVVLVLGGVRTLGNPSQTKPRRVRLNF